MSIPVFTPGYPPDGSSLGQTKAVIRNNLDGTFGALSVDHVNQNGDPGANPAGYHTIIHQTEQTNVTTVTDFNQIFSGVPGTLVVDGITTPTIPDNGDTQLYALTGMGGLSQLTGNYAHFDGYCWLGGILIQWGIVDSGSFFTPNQTGIINFNSTPNHLPFPNNIFGIWSNLLLTSPGSSGIGVGNIVFNEAITTSSATWYFKASATTQYTKFYWVAIGN